MSHFDRRTMCLLGLSTILSSSLALAQDAYPSRPVHLVIGFPPGAAADVTSRVLGNGMGQILGQQIVIENKPGAGSSIAAEYASHAANDGYTILLGSSSNISNQVINPNLSFDMVRDFAPIAPVASVTVVLVVNPSTNVHSVDELIALAKSKPGAVLYASVGVGSAPHFAAELFSQRAGVKLVHVPYQGSPQAIADLIAGRTMMMFSPASTVVGQIAAGKLTALASASSKRPSILPDLPTMAEAGMPDFDTGIWFGLMAPKGTPQMVIDKLAGAVQKAMHTPEAVEILRKQGIEPLNGGPDALKRFIETELARWSDVARAAGLKSCMGRMTMRLVPRLAAYFLFAIAIGHANISRAEDYPTHPVRIIIGFGAGATADVPARLLGQKFSEALGQKFLIENKTGAGSNVAAEYVARSPNDGYTLFMATAAQTNYAGMTVDPTYDVTKDFAPIIRVASVPNILVVHPSLGVDNLKDLIALAKQRPGQIFYGSSGIGSTTHFAGELMNITAGIKLVHVPYPGSAQALTDVLTGRIQMLIAPVSAVMPSVEKGELKAIAVTTTQRASIAPDVPTMAEAGLPGFDIGLWYGLVAPARTPKPIIDKLAHIANDALKLNDLAEPLRKIGVEPIGGTPEEFARYIDGEVKKATKVAIAADLRK
jgi:tripartite-type tricarboxylate transporter receptor subunit TctC